MNQKQKVLREAFNQAFTDVTKLSRTLDKLYKNSVIETGLRGFLVNALDELNKVDKLINEYFKAENEKPVTRFESFAKEKLKNKWLPVLQDHYEEYQYCDHAKCKELAAWKLRGAFSCGDHKDVLGN